MPRAIASQREVWRLTCVGSRTRERGS